MMNLLYHCLTAITVCKPGISAFSTSQQLDQTTAFAADFYHFTLLQLLFKWNWFHSQISCLNICLGLGGGYPVFCHFRRSAKSASISVQPFTDGSSLMIPF